MRKKRFLAGLLMALMANLRWRKELLKMTN